MTVKETVKKFEAYKYYAIIAILSIIVIFFMPFISSEMGMELNLPDTATGWVIYLITKALVVAINLTIFYSFMEQAKLNIRDHPKYIEANDILGKYFKDIKPVPMGPNEWTHKQYRGKGISLAITTLLGAVALTNAVLAFNLVTMVTYLFTIVMGIIFGFIQMGTAENYWTGEYWEYAIYIRDQKESQQIVVEIQTNETLPLYQNEHQQTNTNICTNCAPNLLESNNSNINISNNNQSSFLGNGARVDSNMDGANDTCNTTPISISTSATTTL